MPKKRSSVSIKQALVFIPTLCLLVAVLSLLCFQLLFFNRIYPAILINNQNVGGITPALAKQTLTQEVGKRLKQPLQFSLNNHDFTLKLENIKDVEQLLELSKTIDEAYSLGRYRFYPGTSIFQFKPAQLTTSVNLPPEVLEQIKDFSQSANINPIDAQVKYDGENINVTPSSTGISLDEEKLKYLIGEYLKFNKIPPKALPTKTITPSLNYESALQIKKTLDQVKLSPLKLTYQNQKFFLDLPTLLPLLDLKNTHSNLASIKLGNQEFSVNKLTVGTKVYERVGLVLDQDKLTNYLSQIAAQTDLPVIEPLFNFDGKKVKEFQPPQEGRRLNIEKTAQQINQQIQESDLSDIDLVIEKIPPKNKLTNELGIKELISRGVSNFAGSIANRIYNIGLAASRINGVLIPPGKTFSFAETVGDISAVTGYKQAYVIKSGRTVLDDGGGVCQVSTTLFRAVLNSGLPVVSRTAHAYRVGYYEQGFPPGLDATVFYPSVDFKFVNDTPGHILIQAYLVGTTLNVEFYGSLDGRTVEMTKPVTTNQTPPPPDLRQDDPTLPKGQVKQVDYAAWGANVIFSRKVIRNGQELINETFKSNYRPWQAVFLVGTKE